MGRRAVNVRPAGAEKPSGKGRGKAALRWSEGLIRIRGGNTEKRRRIGYVWCQVMFPPRSFMNWFLTYRRIHLRPLMSIFSWLLVVSFKAQSQDRNEIAFKGPAQSSYSASASLGKFLPGRSANAVSLNHTTVASFPYYHPFFPKTAVMLWHFWTGGRKMWESQILKQQFVPNSLENSLSVCTPSGYLLSGSRRVFVRILRLAVDWMFKSCTRCTKHAVNPKLQLIIMYYPRIQDPG